jgi:hypothetical protein
MTEQQRRPRAEKINEDYYARNNHPSYGQFEVYHFVDDEKRKYKIATENEDTYQNELLRFSPDSQRCRSDTYGEVTLYVKLAPKTNWFEEGQIGKAFIIYNKKNKEEHVVQLKSIYRADYKKRTGSITVGGLGKLVCDGILAGY